MIPEGKDFGQSETYEFVLVCITDGGTNYSSIWNRSYDNAVEAVLAYANFVDHGTCVLDRIITLVEPNGKSHTKVFEYPYASRISYETACAKLRKSDRLLAGN